MSRRSALLLVLSVLAALSWGCGSERPHAETEHELRSESTDEQSGVGVTLSVDRERITTVDRIGVRIEVVRPAGSGVTWDEPAWAESGWGRVGRVDHPPAGLPDGRIRERAEIVLEPFLDGDYTVPPVVVAIGDRRIATAALTVAVLSVLEDPADGELTGPMPVVPPRPERASRTGPIAGVVVIGLAAVLLAWRLTRRRTHGTAAAGPVEALHAVASGQTGPDPLATVHHALERLEQDRPGGFKALARRCERARFAPGGSDDPRSIAREALALLEGGA